DPMAPMIAIVIHPPAAPAAPAPPAPPPPPPKRPPRNPPPPPDAPAPDAPAPICPATSAVGGPAIVDDIPGVIAAFAPIPRAPLTAPTAPSNPEPLLNASITPFPA